jgi:hypothetical protein
MEAAALKLAWQCLSEHYPAITAAALQIIGGGTVLYRVAAAAGGDTAGPRSLLGMATKLAALVGLNRK